MAEYKWSCALCCSDHSEGKNACSVIAGRTHFTSYSAGWEQRNVPVQRTAGSHPGLWKTYLDQSSTQRLVEVKRLLEKQDLHPSMTGAQLQGFQLARKRRFFFLFVCFYLIWTYFSVTSSSQHLNSLATSSSLSALANGSILKPCLPTLPHAQSTQLTSLRSSPLCEQS